MPSAGQAEEALHAQPERGAVADHDGELAGGHGRPRRG